jgi:hypothetical protein
MRRVVATLASRFAVGRLIGLLVALAALHLGCSGAEASCGDWLAGHRSADSADAIETGEAADAPVGSQAPRLPHCDGPACRGVPFMPVLPHDVSADAPRPDPADAVALASIGRQDVGRRYPAANDSKPLAVIAAVPIRPPRRASLQA